MTPSLRTDFVSGFVVVLPLFVCLYVLQWVYDWIADFPLVQSLAPQLPVLSAVSENFSRVVFTLAVLIIALFAIGYLMRTAAGVLLEARLDAAINRVPIFRLIYNASKMAVETAVDDIDVQEPVKLEVWGNHRLTGFRTGKRTLDGQAVVFVPTSPNVTSGIVVETDDSDLERTDESIEDALGRILSAGFGENDDGVDRATLGAFGVGPSEDSSETSEDSSETSEDSSETSEDSSETSEDSSETSEDSSETSEDSSETSEDGDEPPDGGEEVPGDDSGEVVSEPDRADRSGEWRPGE